MSKTVLFHPIKRLLYLHVHFIIFGSEEWSLFHANRLKILKHTQRVDAVDEHDRIACFQFDLAQKTAIIAVKLHHDAAALHDKHLLQVSYLPRKGLVIMRRLGKTGLVSEEAELKRRFRRRKELRLVDARIGTNYLRVLDSAISNGFRCHVQWSQPKRLQ